MAVNVCVEEESATYPLVVDALAPVVYEFDTVMIAPVDDNCPTSPPLLSPVIAPGV